MTDWTNWRKSSFSAESGDCVMVLHTLDALADSKDPAGPGLTTQGLPQLVKAIRTGRLTPIA